MIDNIMTGNMIYVLIFILAVLVVFLFRKSGSSKSLTEQKRLDVERKRAAIRAKRKVQAQASAETKSDTAP